MNKTLRFVPKISAFWLFLAGTALAQHSLTNTFESIERTNDGSTGTAIGRVAKVNSTGNAVTAATTDTAIPLYIVGAERCALSPTGTTGCAELVVGGTVACDFDATTVVIGDFVQPSVTVSGKCHDAGSSFPSSGGALLGVVATSGAGSTNQTVIAYAPGIVRTSGGAGTVTSITAGAGLTTTYGSSGGSITASGTISASTLVDTVSGTSYAFVDGDNGKVKVFTDATGTGNTIAVTLPQAGASSLFLNGWHACVKSETSGTNAGNVVITPTTSTIDTNPTLTIPKQVNVCIVSDGTNFHTTNSASHSVVTFSNGSSVASGQVRYIPLFGNAPTSSVESGAQMHWPIAGVFRQFCLDGVANGPSSATSIIFTFRQNTAAPTNGPSVTLATTSSVSGCDLTHWATVSQSDLVDLQIDNNHSNTNASGANVAMSIVFESFN